MESRPTFSIERILGLELESPRNCLKLHRPWAEVGAEEQNKVNRLCAEQQCGYEQQHQARPPSNWYIGRRPRTAFTNSQVHFLETVFQMNCYPGIQLREQLAGRLDLDEDRIQIWFQNRRAKLRRSFRENRLRMVQSAVADFGNRQEIIGQLKEKQDNLIFAQRLACHLQMEGEEEREE